MAAVVGWSTSSRDVLASFAVQVDDMRENTLHYLFDDRILLETFAAAVVAVLKETPKKLQTVADSTDAGTPVAQNQDGTVD